MSDLSDASADPWTRRFFVAHFGRHPVDATFVGVHEHDHRLPDPSPAGVAEVIDSMRALLAEGSEPAERAERRGSVRATELDRRLAEGFLNTRIQEYESGRVPANPSVLVGDAVFGLMGPLLSDYAPLTERMAAIDSRLRAVPAYLEAARDALTPECGGPVPGGPVRGGPVPEAWTRRAIRECRGALRLIESGLDRVGGGVRADVSTIARDPFENDGFEAARARAARAVRAFSHFLETELLPAGSDDVACGADAFALHLREGHFLRRTPDEVVAYARGEVQRTRAWLEQVASDFDAATPEEVVAGLADLHPTAEGYLDRYRETWDEMRALAVERELVTWPDSPIEYVERPEWARGAAPDLYFLSYRSPAAFGRPDVHRYMVAPLDPTWTADETEAFLRANNDSVIKLNHVVHHGGIGHHVQNWHASRASTLAGRIAAVDCSSRIAMSCGGTMAEGWACYATDLVAEAGGMTERERYAEHFGRVRMCARAIVDVELHHGRMSLEEASAFYREFAGMSPAAAASEAVKNSMFPGSALMYLVGTDLIHELRADLLRTLGEDFVLRDFHDAFLSYGSIPVSLIADEMRRRAEARLPLGDLEAGPL